MQKSLGPFGVVATLALLVATGLAAQGERPLTNDDILKMVAAGFDEETVIKLITASTTAFDTSVDSLMGLKQAGVPEKVIAAMLDAEARKRNSAAAAAPAAENPAPAVSPGPGEVTVAHPPPDPNDPAAPREPGIYWLPKERRDKSMVQLEPSVYSQGKSGGMFAAGMTYGIAKAKWKAVVRSPRANLRISEERPEFWFYFEQTTHGLSYSGSFFGGASSPNEFILARMEKKSNERQLVVGEFGAFGSSTGTRSKDIVDIEFQKVAPGIYRVVPIRPLAPGEYCFFYAGANMAMGMAGGKLFDFGIDPAR